VKSFASTDRQLASTSLIVGKRLLLSFSPLEITFFTPALRASVTNCSDLNMVHMSMGTPGAMRDISPAASNPFLTGMAKSMMTRFGCKLTKSSTAAWPFSASPQTRSSGFCSMHKRIALRTDGLSSTRSIFVAMVLSNGHELGLLVSKGRLSVRLGL